MLGSLKTKYFTHSKVHYIMRKLVLLPNPSICIESLVKIRKGLIRIFWGENLQHALPLLAALFLDCSPPYPWWGSTEIHGFLSCADEVPSSSALAQLLGVRMLLCLFSEYHHEVPFSHKKHLRALYATIEMVNTNAGYGPLYT